MVMGKQYKQDMAVTTIQVSMVLTMIGEATTFSVLLIKYAEESKSAKGTLNKKTSHSFKENWSFCV